MGTAIFYHVIIRHWGDENDKLAYFSELRLLACVYIKLWLIPLFALIDKKNSSIQVEFNSIRVLFFSIF